MDLVEIFMVAGWAWIGLWGAGAVIWLVTVADEVDRR
jgi:hypothetical protein